MIDGQEEVYHKVKVTYLAFSLSDFVIIVDVLNI